jgi:EAL domain-containing protein (putative c-di-GMP-specific phosphodiesterase class I)
MQIATELRNGLANGEFQLYYQPIVCLRTGEIRKAEVLIRWIHPERGVISPVEFIPIAEESAFIHELGSWVFEAAIRQLKQWQAHVNLSLKLSINMSPYQFLNNNPKHEKWLGYINEHGISGNNIVIEITEGLLLKNDKPVKDKLVHYHDLGVQVAIDDFGTGYSSLSYLNEFDIDYLKIDQAFVRKLGQESREQALSEAIVVMAHKLGLRVIAEGIETEQQRDLLIRMGCDYGQGYLFSMPLPAEQFEQACLQSFGRKRIRQG